MRQADRTLNLNCISTVLSLPLTVSTQGVFVLGMSGTVAQTALMADSCRGSTVLTAQESYWNLFHHYYVL